MFTWIQRWPHTALRAALIAAVLIAISGWQVWRLMSLEPTPPTGALAALNESARSGRPDGPNAWDALQLIIDAHPDLHRTNTGEFALLLTRSSDDFIMLAGPWDGMNRSAHLAALEQVRPMLADPDAALELPAYFSRYNFEVGADADVVGRGSISNGVILPHIGPHVALGWINAIAMRADAEARRFDSVARRLRSGLTLGTNLGAQQFLIEGLSGQAIVITHLIETARLIVEHDLTPDAIAGLQKEIDRATRQLDAAEMTSLEGERFILHDFIGWTFTDDGAGDGRFIPAAESRLNGGPGSGIGRLQNVISPIFPGRRVTTAVVNGYYDMLIAAQSLPRNERAAALAEVQRTYSRSGGLPGVLTLSLRSIEAMMERADSLRSRLAGVRAMLLLEARLAETGALPVSLAEAIGAAAIDPVSGEEFEYETEPDGPGGRPFEIRMPWLSNWVERVVNPPRTPLPTLIDLSEPAAADG